MGIDVGVAVVVAVAVAVAVGLVVAGDETPASSWGSSGAAMVIRKEVENECVCCSRRFLRR
jgi:hypothetical protein